MKKLILCFAVFIYACTTVENAPPVIESVPQGIGKVDPSVVRIRTTGYEVLTKTSRSVSVQLNSSVDVGNLEILFRGVDGLSVVSPKRVKLSVLKAGERKSQAVEVRTSQNLSYLVADLSYEKSGKRVKFTQSLEVRVGDVTKSKRPIGTLINSSEAENVIIMPTNEGR